MTSLDNVREKLRRPIPMRGIERRVYAAVFLSLLLGVSWSLATHDWQYLERSGALVIVVGVGLARRDLVQKVGNVEQLYKLDLEQHIASLSSEPHTGLLGEAVRSAKRAEVLEVRNQVNELMRLLKMRLRTTEAAIVCIGTLVWEYGSVVLNALRKLR